MRLPTTFNLRKRRLPGLAKANWAAVGALAAVGIAVVAVLTLVGNDEPRAPTAPVEEEPSVVEAEPAPPEVEPEDADVPQGNLTEAEGTSAAGPFQGEPIIITCDLFVGAPPSVATDPGTTIVHDSEGVPRPPFAIWGLVGVNRATCGGRSLPDDTLIVAENTSGRRIAWIPIVGGNFLLEFDMSSLSVPEAVFLFAERAGVRLGPLGPFRVESGAAVEPALDFQTDSEPRR